MVKINLNVSGLMNQENFDTLVSSWKIIVPVTVAGGAAYCIFFGKTFEEERRRFKSYIVDKTSVRVNDGFREQFNTRYTFTCGQLHETHSHPKSAALRTGGSYSISNFIVAQGYEPYHVSRSNKDTGDGTRLYYHMRDVRQPYSYARLRKNHVVQFTDVDYYVDMNSYIAKMRPIIMYTFAPESVGGEIVEGTFVVENDKVKVTHNGGGRFEHKIWDYNHDYVCVQSSWSTTIASIDQVRVPGDPHHRVICITPQTKVYWPFNKLLNLEDERPLQRMKYTNEGINTLLYHTNQQTYISIGFNNDIACANVPYALYRAMMAKLRATKHPAISDIERLLAVENIPRPYVTASILYELCAMQALPDSYLVDAGEARRTVTYYKPKPLITEDCKDSMRVTVRPFTDPPCVVPAKGYNNDVWCVEDRVIRQINTKVPPAKFSHYATEFVRYVVGDQTGVPMSIGEVIDNMTRKIQLSRAERAKHWLFGSTKALKQSMLKAEAYSDIKPPRNIDTMSSNHSIRLSCFTHAFKKNILKKFDWYIPGDDPVQISDKICDLASGSRHIVSSDFSRFDGTISHWLREHVEFACYKRYFNRDPELLKLLQAELHQTAITNTGFKYPHGCSRLSGSPLTTDGNTIISAFVAYCCYREESKELPGIPPSKAMCYGDDMLLADVTPAMLLRVSDSVGLKVKPIESPPHNPVTFLSRIFVNPWSTNCSMVSLARALPKLHVSKKTTVSNAEAFTAKIMGYRYSDGHTPLLREIIAATLQKPLLTDEQLNHLVETGAVDVPYWYHFETNWPQRFATQDDFAICAKDLGVEVAHLQRWEEEFADLAEEHESIFEFEWQPLELPEPVPRPVDEEIVLRDLPQPVPEPIPPPAQPIIENTQQDTAPVPQPTPGPSSSGQKKNTTQTKNKRKGG